MPFPIDLSHNSPQPLTKALAEAALQRQTFLLGTDREGAAPASTAESDHVTLSPQAQQRLESQAQQQGPVVVVLAGAANSPKPATAPLPLSQTMPLPEGADPVAPALNAAHLTHPANPTNPSNPAAPAAPAVATGTTGMVGALAGLPMPSNNTQAVVLATAVPALPAAAVLPTPWPTGGVNASLHSWVATLVQQLTAPALPQRMVGIQSWPMALAQPANPSALLPTLQTWLVRQGQVQTPEGPRGFSLSLRVPAQWLPTQAPLSEEMPSAATMTPAPMAAPAALLNAAIAAFPGKPQTLQSGAFALVLESPGPAAVRTSALLILDLQPLPQAAVYGRDMLQPRQDPWMQMAVLQASGHVPHDDERAHFGSELCDTPDCPYVGRAACVQPFCMALRSVLPVSMVPAESFISNDRHSASTAA